MSLHQQVASRLPRLPSPRSHEADDGDEDECVICGDPLRESDTVDFEDCEAHRSCVRFVQAIGREVSRRDKVVKAR